MNKNIAIIIGAVLTLSLMGTVISINSTKNTLAQENQKQQVEIEKAKETILIKEERILELEEQVQVLENRIGDYETEIASLKAKVKQYKSDKSYLKGKLRRRNNTIDKLTKQIAELARSRTDETATINNLKEKHKRLLNEVDSAKAEIKNLESKIVNNQDKEDEIRIQEMRARRIHNIVQNTTLVLDKVEARELKESRPMKKVNKDKWRYTYIQFDLQHKDGHPVLVGENFTVTLRDMDTGKILPYIEGNPKFPGNKIETGCPIQFDGNMFIVNYFNNEVKRGQNFEVEVSYVLNGEVYKIVNGTQQIIKDRKVVKVGKKS